MNEYNVKELKKAIETIEKVGKVDNVKLMVDHRGELIISFSEHLGSDHILIKIFSADINKMAEITRTTRL
jgi:hypothetical protein